jgi:Asp-tRNA(Asn)/Glu-tRNA(Gln) amidotransferase A subunit family amidase
MKAPVQSVPDWSWLPLRELGRRLRQGELSPVALAEHCLERLERLGPRFNAVVTLTRKRALAEAARAEAELRAGRVRGPLHGIPYGAKDLLATAGGIPTSWGFGPLRDQTFPADAAAIERLTEAGAVLVAKLAMVELAGGMRYDQPNASFTGPGRNPWNPGAWTGGSSSGSGAAVAAGLVPFAIGTETHGSITGPTAMCGLTGLRPGFGRVSRRGAMALSWTLDKIGPLCHGADDCGLVFEAIAGPDPGDPATLPDAYRYGPAQPPAERWRLCLLKGEDVSDQPAVGANFRAALEVLRPLAAFSEAELPPNPYHETVMTILLAEAGSAFAHLAESGLAAQLAAPETRITPYALQSIPAAAYVSALRIRRRLHRELESWLAPYDAVVTPTLKKVAPPLDRRFSDYFGAYRRLLITSVGNLLGWPCVTVPTGFGERGLPTSLQFVGRPGSENALLAMARHYQQSTDWHLRRPPTA